MNWELGMLARFGTGGRAKAPKGVQAYARKQEFIRRKYLWEDRAWFSLCLRTFGFEGNSDLDFVL